MAQLHNPLHPSPQGSIVLLIEDAERKAEIELRERLSVPARRLPSLVDAPGCSPKTGDESPELGVYRVEEAGIMYSYS